MSSSRQPERPTLFVVTGFLGSGKTTLISALLHSPALPRTAVIVNELGEIGIDDAVMADVHDGACIALLKNGCLCCQSSGELQKLLFRLLGDARRPLERIIVETTGLADPVQLLQALIADPRLVGMCRVGNIITTVDAVAGLQTWNEHPVSLNQAAIADHRIITKSDIAAPVEVQRLADGLRQINPFAQTHVVVQGAIDPAVLFGNDLSKGGWVTAAALGVVEGGRLGQGHETGGKNALHDPAISTHLIELEQPSDWWAVSSRVARILAQHGTSLLRLKGLLWTTDDPRPLVIHGAQRTFHRPIRLRQWPHEPKTRLVLIGRQLETISKLIQEAFIECSHPQSRLTATARFPFAESALEVNAQASVTR